MELKETKEDQQGLTKRQRDTIPFLAISSTYEEGRRKAGIGKTTLYRWLKNPEFKYAIQEERNKIVDEALIILKLNLTKAVNTLVGLLDEKGNPELKRRVANDIIEHTFKVQELQELEGRLKEVERRVIVFENV